MCRLLASELSIALSLVVGHIMGSLGSLKILTVLQSQRSARDTPTPRPSPSHINDELSSWTVPRSRISATTQVALATCVLIKLALSLAPSYSGPWSLVFIAQVLLLVGGATVACQSTAFSDAESVVGALLGIYAYELTADEKSEIEITVRARGSPEDPLGSSPLELLRGLPVVGTLISHGLAAALCVGAFILESHICVDIILVAFLANEVQRAPLRNVTANTCQACWSSLRAFQKLAECGACACLFYYLLIGRSSQILGRSLQDIRLDAPMSRGTGYILSLCTWCYLCLVGPSSVALASLAVKIDYCRRMRNSKQSDEGIAEPAAVVFDLSRPSIAFLGPYYTSSIISLLLSAAASLALAETIPLVYNLHDQLILSAFACIFPLISIIFVLLGIFLQAWRLGELSFVWAFNEEQALSRNETGRKEFGRADSVEFLKIQERTRLTDLDQKAGNNK